MGRTERIQVTDEEGFNALCIRISDIIAARMIGDETSGIGTSVRTVVDQGREKFGTRGIETYTDKCIAFWTILNLAGYEKLAGCNAKDVGCYSRY